LAGLRSLLKTKEKVALYAVSVDAPDKSKELKEKIAADGKGAVSFPILSDPDHRVIAAYGLVDHRYDGKSTQGINFEGIPIAATYLIDKNGRVVWARFDEDYKQRPPNEAIRAALEALKKKTHGTRQNINTPRGR
jgi:peroxiredoxin